MARYLVTGAAGFIGFSLSRALLQAGHEVVGIDSYSPYYDVSLKHARTALLSQHAGFTMHDFALEEMEKLESTIAAAKPEIVFHLAAQAGVRYSIENPRAYIDANLIGTFNLLEAMRRHTPRHLMLASTSSVYGANTKMPFAEDDSADHPLTLYAATKKSTEVMAHAYSHLWSIPTSVFRFFTVYGPWGRPDMALFIFTRNILEGRPIDVFNYGRMERDFTYIDDLVQAMIALGDTPPEDPRAIGTPPAGDWQSPVAPYRRVNIGLKTPVPVTALIDEIERCVGKPAIRNLLPIQPGDVERTMASTDVLEQLIDAPAPTPLAEGVRRFVEWYRGHYGV